VNQVVRKLEACAADSIQCPSSRDLQFDTVKREAAHFTRRRGHKKHPQQNFTAKINVGDGFVWVKKEATRWLGVWMDAHLTFKEHYNRCMKKARAAEARLRVLTRMHAIIPERVRAVQIAWDEAVALYGSELWVDPKEIGRREDLQLLLNRQARSTLGALPTTSPGLVMRHSGLTPAAVAHTSRQQQFAARLASACDGSRQQVTYNHPTSGAPICSVIEKEHELGREPETLCRPRPDEEPVVKTVILNDDTAAKREAKPWARESEANVGAGVWMWWTDGSRSDDCRVGAAAVRKHRDGWRAYRSHLGTGRMEVYDSEV
jgi:hypothetical protein